MIQALNVAKHGARWVGIWAVVTVLLVGSLTSYTWAQLAFAKKYWAVDVIKSED